MQKLKALYAKLKPENPLYRAILKTLTIVTLVIIGFYILAVKPELFGLLVFSAIIVGLIVWLFLTLYNREQIRAKNKKWRK